MDAINLYEIDSKYIQYLSAFEEHLFRNKKLSKVFTRKYIGVVLKINGFDYFAPLSSFKPKHKRLSETKDFIKVGTLAVINLNNMFPAPMQICKQVVINDKSTLITKILFARNTVSSSKRHNSSWPMRKPFTNTNRRMTENQSWANAAMTSNCSKQNAENIRQIETNQIRSSRRNSELSFKYEKYATRIFFI